jgi:hypothetical protein
LIFIPNDEVKKIKEGIGRRISRGLKELFYG